MKLLFISLGCDKNLVDSEHMLALLSQRDIELTDDETEAEMVIINSCCFIGDALNESIETVIEMGELKKTAKLKYLIVTGCMAERYAKDIPTELPEVDAIVGTNSYDEIVSVVDHLIAGDDELTILKPLEGVPDHSAGRLLTTGGHFAYLKIAEGCNKRCTYCVIPSIRGNYRSFPLEELVLEATQLAEQGVKELILVAQETTLYGVDLYGEKSLPQLLKALSEIPGISWIRLQYCYPEEITDDLIREMATNPKICHYIDMPIQHCSDRILKKMGRLTSKADIISIVKKLRDAMPDICIRTTLICGFPSETEEEHAELCSFVNDMQFDHLGCFAYSREEGTPAATFDGQIDEELMQEWVADIMELQQEISSDCNASMIGQNVLAFVEGKVADEDAYVARTYRDAPDVDGYLFIQTSADLHTGDFVETRITGSSEYDLIGELL